MIFSSEGSLGSPNESVCIMPEIILNKTNNGLMSTGHPENDFRLNAKYCHFLSTKLFTAHIACIFVESSMIIAKVTARFHIVKHAHTPHNYAEENL